MVKELNFKKVAMLFSRKLHDEFKYVLEVCGLSQLTLIDWTNPTRVFPNKEDWLTAIGQTGQY